MLSPLSTSCPTSPCAATCNGFSLIWLNPSCPKPECDQVSTLNLRLPAFEGCLILRVVAYPAEFSHFQGIGLQLLVLWKLTQSALHQRTASIRRYTEPKKILYLGLFGVCVDGHRGSLFSDKANFIISVHRQNCGPKKIINYCVLLEDLTKQIIKSGPKTKMTLKPA